MYGTKKETLQVTSAAFQNNGPIPIVYTGWGDDISPDFKLSNLASEANSIAIMMDDLNHPIPGYNHWVIWDLPVMKRIPENIPYESRVTSLGNATQGIGYGKHRYKGPKPPSFMKKPHRYVFHVFALDTLLNLPEHSRKKTLIKAMGGHVIQYGNLTGVWSNTYRSGR